MSSSNPDLIPTVNNKPITVGTFGDTRELRMLTSGLPEGIVTVITDQEYSEIGQIVVSSYEKHQGIYIPDGLTRRDELGLGVGITLLGENQAAPVIDAQGDVRIVWNKHGKPKDIAGSERNFTKLRNRKIPLLAPLQPGHKESARLIQYPVFLV